MVIGNILQAQYDIQQVLMHYSNVPLHMTVTGYIITVVNAHCHESLQAFLIHQDPFYWIVLPRAGRVVLANLDGSSCSTGSEQEGQHDRTTLAPTKNTLEQSKIHYFFSGLQRPEDGVSIYRRSLFEKWNRNLRNWRGKAWIGQECRAHLQKNCPSLTGKSFSPTYSTKDEVIWPQKANSGHLKLWLRTARHVFD